MKKKIFFFFFSQTALLQGRRESLFTHFSTLQPPRELKGSALPLTAKSLSVNPFPPFRAKHPFYKRVVREGAGRALSIFWQYKNNMEELQERRWHQITLFMTHARKHARPSSRRTATFTSVALKRGSPPEGPHTTSSDFTLSLHTKLYHCNY